MNGFDLFSLLENDVKEATTKESDHTQEVPSDVKNECCNTPSEAVVSTNNDSENNTMENEVEEKSSKDLFEDISQKVEEAESTKKKEKQEEKKKSSTNDSFDVNEFTVIRYYREEIPLTDYFTVEEIAEGVQITKTDGTIKYKKIDGEMVRSRLEKDYPEFVKGHTEMLYYGGKRNFIIPVMIAKKKGNYSIEAEKEVSSNDTSFSLPKIPVQLLLKFIEIARAFGKHHLEVCGEIYYNFDTEKYLLYIPKQTVNRNYVVSNESPGYFQTQMLEKYDHYVQLVCEIHSHHVYDAIPSQLDNENERVPGMFYVIVGRTDKDVPSVFCRTFSLETGHVPKSVTDIFKNYDHPFELIEWSLRDIKIIK